MHETHYTSAEAVSDQPEAAFLNLLTDGLFLGRQMLAVKQRADLAAAILVDHPLERLIGLQHLLDLVRRCNLFQKVDDGIAFPRIKQRHVPVVNTDRSVNQTGRQRVASSPEAMDYQRSRRGQNPQIGAAASLI